MRRKFINGTNLEMAWMIKQVDKEIKSYYNCIPYVQEADETLSMVSRAMKDIHLKNTQIKSLRDKQLQCSN